MSQDNKQILIPFAGTKDNNSSPIIDINDPLWTKKLKDIFNYTIDIMNYWRDDKGKKINDSLSGYIMFYNDFTRSFYSRPTGGYLPKNLLRIAIPAPNFPDFIGSIFTEGEFRSVYDKKGIGVLGYVHIPMAYVGIGVESLNNRINPFSIIDQQRFEYYAFGEGSDVFQEIIERAGSLFYVYYSEWYISFVDFLISNGVFTKNNIIELPEWTKHHPLYQKALLEILNQTQLMIPELSKITQEYLTSK